MVKVIDSVKDDFTILPEGWEAKNIQKEAKEPLKPKPEKREKPLVEGINTPKSTSDIIFVKQHNAARHTEGVISENVGSSGREPKLLPSSVINRLNKKPAVGKGLALLLGAVAIILVLLGGYKFYVWYFNMPKAPILSGNTLNSGAAGLIVGAPSSTPLLALGESLGASTTLLSTATTTPNSAPPKVVLKLKIDSTPTGFLNVRKSASVSGVLITKINPGEVYTYITKDSGWYQIILKDNTTGWVSGQYITEQ